VANLDPLRIPAAYWEQCVQDEIALAPLMGYSDLQVPGAHDRAAWIFGSKGYEFASEVGPKTVPIHVGPLPRWRRDAHALGDLFAKVPADLTWHSNFVHLFLNPPDGLGPFSLTANYQDHPSNTHALRKALVDLAIAYLGEKKRAADAKRLQR
jgi:hypothetical protein